MKNLVIAVVGLIIIILLVFVFSSKNNSKNDTLVPSPLNVASQSPNLVNLNSKESTAQGQKMQLPFPILASDQINGKKIKISTDKGDIVFELTADSSIAASNFIYLTNRKFYDGLIFHRVIKGFMVQGGDPKGDGTGGPDYNFADELNSDTQSYKQGYTRGTVAMANAGPHTNGSQFFIMHQDYQLPHNYTIFGHVVSGMDIVDAIASSQTDSNDKPIQPIRMTKVTVE